MFTNDYENHDLDHLSAAEQIEHEQDFAAWNAGIEQAFADEDIDPSDDWHDERLDDDDIDHNYSGSFADDDEYFSW